jgi:hypothetical protein
MQFQSESFQPVLERFKHSLCFFFAFESHYYVIGIPYDCRTSFEFGFDFVSIPFVQSRKVIPSFVPLIRVPLPRLVEGRELPSMPGFW